MNTTELYVEPVLVGFLVLATVALLWVPDIHFLLAKLAGAKDSVPEGIAVGAVLVGVAYLIGIPADRLIDTGLSGIERHARARFVISLRKRTDYRPFEVDPYPEDAYRALIMLAGGSGATDWLAYVRTRMRLARALAFIAPALTFAAILALTHTGQCPCKDEFHALKDARTLIVPATYALMLLLAFLLPTLDDRPQGRWNPPRTDKRGDLDEYSAARALENADRGGRGGKRFTQAMDLALQAFPIGATALLIASAVVGWRQLEGVAVPVAIAGALLTWGAAYAWWRSNFTFMTYVNLFGREIERERRRAAAPN